MGKKTAKKELTIKKHRSIQYAKEIEGTNKTTQENKK